ncbi:MAG TPA: hypothetical protein VKE74_04180 [Gemmataceae bacterium]|nr:hypothetical protein [Gemmataceae bacterium]
MRTLLAVSFLAAVGLSPAANPPAKKADPPHAMLAFSRDRTLRQWVSTFEMTTASGQVYGLWIEYGARGNMYDTDTLKALLAANWVAAPTEDGSVRVYGVRTAEGKTDAVKSLTVTNRLVKGTGQMPKLSGIGEVKVDTKEDDGKARPAAEKRPPTGPKIADDTFVEFDLTTLPPGAMGVFWRLTFEVRTTAEEEEPWIRIPMEVASDGAAETITDVIEITLADAGFKSEVVGKTKFRVYGGVWEGRYYPATKGSVESPNLKKEQLPKVTDAMKKL